MKNITITINLGNDAMHESDVAQALRDLAKRIDAKGLDYVTKVMDGNGNSVGTVETN